jgi:hypothetical protein
VPNLPESTSMQHPQKIDFLVRSARLIPPL